MKIEEKHLLAMENISKCFQSNTVLHNVNFFVKEGEIVGLVGENGAGKSTLMNILFGAHIIKETGGFQGKITFDGKEVNFASPLDAISAGIGMIHQELSLIPEFSVTENIVLNRETTNYHFLSEIFGEKVNTLNREDMQKRAIENLNELEVQINPDILTKNLSIGYRQFVEIAREIDRKSTKLLIFDEPTAVLTESEVEKVINIIRKIASKNISIIFISHKIHEVFDICDRIVVLRDGFLQNEFIPSKTSHKEVVKTMVGRKRIEKTQRDSPLKNLDENILEVNQLYVNMPGEQVNGVTFTVKKGEIFGIGGLTGQGKLGIANGIIGLYPANGEVKFKGEDINLNNTKKMLKHGIAFVSEERRKFGLLLDQPVFLNIAFNGMEIKNKFVMSLFGGLIHLRDEKEMIKIAREYIQSLQIKCVNEKQYVRELSGGNQQKVCLASAFTLEPEVLFVSEPTRGIDVGAKALVINTLCNYNRQYGTTIIITSSELDELISISDRIAIISNGEIAGILPSNSNRIDFGLLMLGEK